MDEQGNMKDEEIATQDALSIQDVPELVFSRLLSFIPVNDLTTCRLVCRSWRDDPATQKILRTRHKSVHFRRVTDINFFEWLMRTTPGNRIPFSKFTFHVDQDIAPIDIENFMNSSEDRTGLALQFKISRLITTYDPLRWNMANEFWQIRDYPKTVHGLLLATTNLTSLSLVAYYGQCGVEFPDNEDEATYFQAFRNLQKFKVKFALLGHFHYDRRPILADRPTFFEKVIRYSPRLQVLSLLYYPYFCEVAYEHPGMPEFIRHRANGENYAEDTMRTKELQRLPDFLRLLRSRSTKVKLRLGIVTNTFQDVWNRLITLDPQPRIVALAISLPTELDTTLRTAIWNVIQILPLKKLKFFEDRAHYDDIPALPTAIFHGLHQLRLTSVKNITSNGAHLLFPNLRKLSVFLSGIPGDGRAVYPDFEGFCSLVAGVPQLEHLKLTGNPWEVLTGELYDVSVKAFARDYFINQVINVEVRESAVANPIRELKSLKSLELTLECENVYSIVYASVAGRLQRLSHIIFAKHKNHDGHPSKYKGSIAANTICKYHDKVSFLGKHRI